MDNITSLDEKLVDLEGLQVLADTQFKASISAKKSIAALEKENRQLKEIIAAFQMAAQRSQEPEVIIKSNEQLICEMEIEKLRITSIERSLTLEETKRLDLLIKNLYLCKGAQKEINADFRNAIDIISEETLMAIAMSPPREIS